MQALGSARYDLANQRYGIHRQCAVRSISDAAVPQTAEGTPYREARPIPARNAAAPVAHDAVSWFGWCPGRCRE
jgi:hypothetical protein